MKIILLYLIIANKYITDKLSSKKDNIFIIKNIIKLYYSILEFSLIELIILF